MRKAVKNHDFSIFSIIDFVTTNRIGNTILLNIITESQNPIFDSILLTLVRIILIKYFIFTITTSVLKLCIHL